MNYPSGNTTDISPFLMISGHDYRSKRQANVHFIMEELAHRGPSRFFSIGYSFLSLIKHDPRVSLWKKANRVESHKGVKSYLWRTPLHPFHLRLTALSPLADAGFRFYAQKAPKVLHRWIRESHTILLESGMSIIFIDLIKALNPTARVIYICSDALDTIGCAPYLINKLKESAPMLDGIRIPSHFLRSEFSTNHNIYYVPHGMDTQLAEDKQPSPYGAGTHLISVGSMLFDPSFFEIAAAALPEITFHVIGGGKKAETLSAPNIVVRKEMPFRETIPYIRHAHAGIAPYEGGKVAPYLVDTSMKMMQFGFFGLPAICPQVAAHGKEGRFGYVPGDRDSIVKAIRDALAFGRFEGIPSLSWSEVTDRILHPEAYTDTFLKKEN